MEGVHAGTCMHDKYNPYNEYFTTTGAGDHTACKDPATANIDYTDYGKDMLRYKYIIDY